VVILDQMQVQNAIKIEAIPVDNDGHPDPPHFTLPKHEFTWGFVAPPGSGKTTLLINLLMKYAGYFHQIKVFSPTVLSDSKWDYLKKQKLLVENKPLKKWIAEKVEEQKAADVVSERPVNRELQAVEDENNFTEYLTDDDFFDDYDHDNFEKMMTQQKALIEIMKTHDLPKEMVDRVLIVFDDLVGSPLFKGEKGNYFTGVTTRHRHHSASFFWVSQGYKEIPKTIRTAAMCLVIFEIGNDMEIRVIYEEWGMGLSWKDWMEVYKEAVGGGGYDFLFFNRQQKNRDMRMMKNFDRFLIHRPDEVDRKYTDEAYFHRLG